MTVFIALLQGVNVGKHKRISMADLKRIVSDLGGDQPTTVANSGNVVFTHAGAPDEENLRVQLETAISDHVGLPVPVILRTAADMRQVVTRNPYPKVDDPTQLHVEFLNGAVADALADLELGEDHLTMVDREVYLHLPNKMSGITYDAKTLVKRLGSHHTSRNWNTVTKLSELADGMEQLKPSASTK